MTDWTQHSKNAEANKAKLWPSMPRDISYMSTSATAPLPGNVAELAVEGCQAQLQPWNLAFPGSYLEDLEEMRHLVAQIMDVSVDSIAIGSATAYYSALAALHLEPLLKAAEAPSILLLAGQYHSNHLVWKKLATKFGAEIVEVPAPDDKNWTRDICDILESRKVAGKPITFAALPQCHWTDGSVVDLEAVCKLLHEQESTIFLDLTQSLGAIPLDITKLRPHYVVASSYKWLFCPFGFAFCYIDPNRHSLPPLEEPQFTRPNGGFQDDGSLDVDYFVRNEDSYATGARKFDCGGRALPGLGKICINSLKLVKGWMNSGELLDHIHPLSKYLCESAAKIHFQVVEKDKRLPHINGIRFPKSSDSSPQALQALQKQLASENVFVSIRGTSIRVTLHLWNSKEDIDKLIQVLKTNC